MMKRVCGLLMLLASLALSVAASQAAGEADEMTENPKYKLWASFKPGATSTYTETTKLQGPEKASVPGGVDRKTITYRLLSVTKDKVVVVTTVVEEDFLSTVESAPTKITYSAKVKKANLQAFFQEWSAKEGADETIKIKGKELVCKVRSGSHKVEGGTVEGKICICAEVPGGMVAHTRATRDGDKIVAETITTLVSFAEATEKKKDKDK